MKKNVRRAVAIGVTGAVFAGAATALGIINGSGASFPRIAYQNWCADAGNICNYQSVGSGAGIKAFTAGTVDFAASDAPLSAQQLSDLSAQRNGVTPLYFPTLLGAVTVPVNIPGVTGNAMKLDGKTVGDIFDGSVTSWNDPKIKAVNPKLNLPASPITVCVRSDGSGTSFNFSRYLSKVNPGFSSAVSFSQTPPWKAPSLVKGNGNAGVANCVKSNTNSIGYVDLGDAINAGLSSNITSIGKSEITTVTVKKNGKKVKKTVRKTVYIRPSIASIQAAGNLKTLKPDLTVDFTASPNKGAYPITITTWILAYSDYSAAGRKDSLPDVKTFLNYAYTAPAQDKLTSLGFSPLPANVLTAAKAQLAKLK